MDLVLHILLQLHSLKVMRELEKLVTLLFEPLQQCCGVLST